MADRKNDIRGALDECHYIDQHKFFAMTPTQLDEYLHMRHSLWDGYDAEEGRYTGHFTFCQGTWGFDGTDRECECEVISYRYVERMHKLFEELKKKRNKKKNIILFNQRMDAQKNHHAELDPNCLFSVSLCETDEKQTGETSGECAKNP